MCETEHDADFGVLIMMKRVAITTMVLFALASSALAQQPIPPNPAPAPGQQPRPQPAQTQPAITLPQGVVREAYYRQLRTRATGSPPWKWKLVGGTLPPGLAVGRDGVVSGTPTSAGDYRFRVEATDSASPAQKVQIDVLLPVRNPLACEWAAPPVVADRGGNGIFGSLTVTNASTTTMDLTVIIVAVNEMGRATALGYQHFMFAPGTQMIPFGSTLPRGNYIVHADAVGEVARTQRILRA